MKTVLMTAATMACLYAPSGAIAETTERFVTEVRGTTMAITLTRPFPTSFEIRLKRGYKDVPNLEMHERMQVALNLIGGCKFDPASLQVNGRDIIAHIHRDCWYYPDRVRLQASE